MNDTHSPRLLDQPLHLHCALRLTNQAKAEPLGTDPTATQALAEALSVRVDLDQPVVNRLFELWNTLLAIEADELGDWSLPASARINHCLVGSTPALLGVGATVYASGEVAFAVMAEGIDVPLWFAYLIDLHDLERLHRARPSAVARNAANVGVSS
ncbi:hypothetical protein [Ideonella sp. YS5]|uniref:hypothetical protein n=1 Tax=Ideonella sp. YS5 TaxID=3453714 RepID=UPI003EEFDF9B